MKLAMMQPYYFPYIGYFQLINSADKFVIYDDLNFIKEGWINRNRYIVINEGPKYFNLLIKSKSSNKKIKDIQLIKGKYWRSKIEKSLYLNYKKARFFDEVFPFIRRMIYIETSYLTEYNTIVIYEICKYLDIDTEITIAREKHNGIESKIIDDYRNTILGHNLNVDLKNYRVLKVCKLENAYEFVNPIGGISLYSKTIFKQNGIKLMFHKTKDIIYKQMNNKFEKNISIIDVLLNCGKKDTQELLPYYDFY